MKNKKNVYLGKETRKYTHRCLLTTEVKPNEQSHMQFKNLSMTEVIENLNLLCTVRFLLRFDWHFSSG